MIQFDLVFLTYIGLILPDPIKIFYDICHTVCVDLVDNMFVLCEFNVVL